MRPEPEQLDESEGWQLGQLLADRYRVKECLRQSGTSQLFGVQDVFRGDYHLILRPSPRILGMEGWKEWFEQFCRNALSVPPHANLLSCERMSEERKLPFLILEDAEGRGWDSVIFDHSLRDLPGMVDVARKVAKGLDWLHGHDHIHFNVKPGNVLIGDSGLVKLWKYGESDAKTRAYASPEQLAGEWPLTSATDVWSWGVSVLHMFVGRIAWQSGTDAPSALRRYMLKGPARHGIPLMPAGVAKLLARCFKSNPGERLATMAEIVETLEAVHTHVQAGPAEAPAGGAAHAAAEGAAQKGAAASSDGGGPGSEAAGSPPPA